MAEKKTTKRSSRRMSVHYRGRGSQVSIYLGKMLRMFLYQNDWKVLPMAALIAGLVGMVIRKRLFITMEGTLMGAFAMVMVCIWNGCFNSIQVICRERDVIKREHRSGMHISSYVCSHMIYQALLCLLQTGVTLYITKAVGVKYPEEGLFTPLMIVDFGISMFLITYASDMMSLWVSSLSRTTTTAMTIMPFVLIFQLVFSGGMLTLPAWTTHITPLTISNPGLKVLTAQGDYNSRPVMTIWNTVNGMRDRELTATVTPRQAVELLQSEDNPTVARLRQVQLARVFTLGEIKDLLESSETVKALREKYALENITVRDILQLILDADQLKSIRELDFKIPGMTLGKLIGDLMEMDRMQSVLDTPLSEITAVSEVLGKLNIGELLERHRDLELGMNITLGEAVDMLASNPDVQASLDKSYTLNTTVGAVIDVIGEDRVKDILQNKVAEASRVKAYENTRDNILGYWLRLLVFVLAFAALSTITLEFIDKDKR